MFFTRIDDFFIFVSWRHARPFCFSCRIFSCSRFTAEQYDDRRIRIPAVFCYTAVVQARQYGILVEGQTNI
jgi:hypothetical protein